MTFNEQNNERDIKTFHIQPRATDMIGGPKAPTVSSLVGAPPCSLRVLDLRASRPTALQGFRQWLAWGWGARPSVLQQHKGSNHYPQNKRTVGRLRLFPRFLSIGDY